MHSSQRADFDSPLPHTIPDRRSFLVGSLAAGFALAVRPVSAQAAVLVQDLPVALGAASPGRSIWRAQQLTVRGRCEMLLVKWPDHFRSALRLSGTGRSSAPWRAGR